MRWRDGVCASFCATADSMTHRQLLRTALLVRVAVLLLMAVSCRYIPDFSSGDESLAAFDLRLKQSSEKEPAFALAGSFCECGFSCLASPPPLPAVRESATTSRKKAKAFWSFLLTPLTRWDAARFLRLAHRPTIRYPQLERLRLVSSQQTADEHGNIDTDTCRRINKSVIQASEEAHPFLPLFPLMIQVTATIITWCIPTALIPPTCESTLALGALVLNTICFVWTASELYKMTKLIYLHSATRFDDASGKPLSPSSLTSEETQTMECQARRVVLLFIVNPANVFFGTAYSESLGAALVFTGCRCMIQQRVSQQQKNATLLHTCAVALWWLGCWVRSNSSLYAGFLLLHSIGRSFCSNQNIVKRLVAIPIGVFTAMLLLVGGIGLHNYRAFRNHCVEIVLNDEQTSTGTESGCLDVSYQSPEWCEYDATFNLYSHVQRKYWNVGLFRYYEWNQIPNFLLATPVLVLSTAAVVTWIQHSWVQSQARTKRTETRSSSSGLQSIVRDLIEWVVFSLRLFVAGSLRAPKSLSVYNDSSWCYSPILLGHYAVLAASTLLLLTVAHVQIATRLICSTCPALYWFLSTQINRGGMLGDAILGWCLLYILLGTVMHPNWLPWT